MKQMIMRMSVTASTLMLITTNASAIEIPPVATVPEPSVIGLLGAAGIAYGVVSFIRRRKK